MMKRYLLWKFLIRLVPRVAYPNLLGKKTLMLFDVVACPEGNLQVGYRNIELVVEPSSMVLYRITKGKINLHCCIDI
jgi:hypothetical protein